MFKCPNCQATLTVSSLPKECPKCGTPLASSPSAKTVFQNDATVDGTIDLDMSFESSQSAEVNHGEAQKSDPSKTAKLDDATIDSTLDSTDFLPAKTRDEELRKPSLPQQSQSSSMSGSANDATIDVDLMAGLNASELVGETLGPDSVNPQISPGATININASGLSVGRSGAQPSQIQGSTLHAGSKRTGGQGKTGGNTSGGSSDSSLDFNRSILSTISRRTLSEKSESFETTPDYEIVSKLGEGGMGVVYSAIQKTLERKVAIKAIKASKSGSEESKRKFFYEAQITGDLGHPNIVPIHEMGSNNDGTLFYSMKMVDGTPWEDAIQEKDRMENIEILMKVCDAVAFAHSRNIIHRDLKPENVMLGAYGEVLVMDWGLAVNLDSGQSFGLSGTPVYMSPEMARHEVSKIGKASDIYILGAILFQIVVGQAPHKGKTVRECMANAMKNENIDPGFEDPLLDIANHAMAMEPSERYASVVDFQEAIREYLRHAQSIALSHRAEELLQQAIRDQDYQGFSRSLFSLQDAIELWPGNQDAIDGLHRTRLAYGQCALERSDYDLCLQTLDTRIEAEAALHRTATERKAGLVQREKRFQLLRKVLAAVILFAVTSLTIATLYARWQTQIAQEQRQLALTSAEAEKAARVNEEGAKRVAQEERDKAKQSAEDERIARKSEEEARQVAQAERDRAVMAEQQEKQAKELEVVARKQAVASEQSAKLSEQKAIQSEKVAVRNARLALLGNYQSQLNLALNQTNQFDIARSNQLLEQIQSIDKSIDAGNETPDGKFTKHDARLQNWAYRRIELLNNGDLPRVNVASPITTLSYASEAKLGIIGTRSGQVSIVQLDEAENKLLSNMQVSFQDPIQSLALSPDGQEAIIATAAQQSEFSVYRWKPHSNELTPVRSLGKRNLQQLAISPDGKWAVGGINAGLWKWERASDGFAAEPSQLLCKGELVCLQFVGDQSDEVFGLSKLPNNKAICIRANLKTSSVETYSLPESIETQASAAALSIDLQHVYLGLNDGNLLVARFDQSSSREVSKPSKLLVKSTERQSAISVESDIQPKKHSTPVRSIVVHRDGTVLTHSEEPVVHVWKTESVDERLSYSSFLVGLAGNVTKVRFLSGKGNVVASDDQGSLLRWNILEQEDRRGMVRAVPSPLLSQSMSADGSIRSMDEEGVLRSRTAKLSQQESYLGHTPGSKLTDIAVALKEPLVATIALLPSGNASDYSSEVCIWNTTTRDMLQRTQHKTSGSCRIAFVNRDSSIVIGDGKETLMISINAGGKATQEKRFGTRLVAPHPTEPRLSAIIAPSGAVRIVDWQDVAKWDDDRYRFFDLAINNRFEPIEAGWAPDGKRLYILFEHGRIARLDWDGASLGSLSWSDEIPSLRSVEQLTPWRYFDFAVKAGETKDRIEIEVRTSESKSRTNLVQLIWSWNDAKPSLVSESAPSVAKPVTEYASKTLHDIARTALGTLISVDQHGILCVAQSDQEPFSLGRPPCLRASHNVERTRWATVHAQGIVLLANIVARDPIVWQQVRHPFVSVTQAELSADGSQLALVGKLPNGANKLMRFDVKGNEATTQVQNGEWSNILFVRWHPIQNEFVTLDMEQNWHRVDSQGRSTKIETEAWRTTLLEQKSQFVNMEWLAEPTGNATDPILHLAILSRSEDSSRIDLVSLDGSAKTSFQPIVSKSAISSFATAGDENVMAIGDETGTLGIWFIAPSIDQSPRELFTLPGHRGAEVTQLSFSSDGSTILSSDSSLRSIQWRSR